MGSQLRSCLETVVVDEVACSCLRSIQDVLLPLLKLDGSEAANAVDAAAAAEFQVQQLDNALVHFQQVTHHTQRPMCLRCKSHAAWLELSGSADS